jgi:hypothetical protein
MSMTKFREKGDNGYKRVRNQLKRWIRDDIPPPAGPSSPPSSGAATAVVALTHQAEEPEEQGHYQYQSSAHSPYGVQPSYQYDYGPQTNNAQYAQPRITYDHDGSAFAHETENYTELLMRQRGRSYPVPFPRYSGYAQRREADQ